MVPIPEKSPLPKPGESWYWRKRYFDIGEVIEWRNWSEPTKHAEIVTAIKVNNMRRVSYYAGSRFIMIEDVARVMRDENA